MKRGACLILLLSACSRGGAVPSGVIYCQTDGAVCPPGLTCRDGVCVCLHGEEVCDALDNDCDGEIDEVGPGGLVDVGGACTPQGACSEGTLSCVAGELRCDPAVGPEVCNGRDDDCDGVADDGVAPCGDPAACACAPGGPGPSAEVCNAVDDDCNDMVDDGLVGCACAACGVAFAEACNQVDDDCNGLIDDGLPACPCAPGGPGASAEVCNGIDDDCDGVVDDGLTACACAPGGPGPSAEVCNGIDDDCDGVVDDGLAACACAPGGPGPSPEVCNGIDDDCDGAIDEVNSLTGAPCGQFGDPCAVNSDCSSGLCVGDAFDMYCTQPCAMIGDPGDCPAGYRCWDNPSLGGTDSCRRNYAPCASDADCGPGEVCAITCNDAGDAAVTECRPAIPGGAPATSPCTASADCATFQCFRTDICTEVCAEDADCGPGYRCVFVYTGQCGGDYVPRCLDACDCDTECPAGQYCQPYLQKVLPPATPAAVGACDLPGAGGGPGADCDLTATPPLTCSHLICSNSGTGFCTQMCSATCGCPLPIGPCTSTFLTFGGGLGTHPAMTCDTP